MVRRLGVVLGCLALVVATISIASSPVSAKPGSAKAAATRVVAGHNLSAAGLQEGWVGCESGSTPPTPQRLVRMGGTLGSHSIGWQPGTGYGAGALAHTAHPASLSSFQGDVWVPSGSGTGYAVVFYYDQTRPGYWFGTEQLTYSGSGFATANLASDVFSWRRIVNGSVAEGPYGYTIPNFTAATGAGDSGGADLGILMGCEGQPYYFDNLRVADAFDQTTYDFEGATSASRLGWNITGRKVTYTNLTVPYGQKVWMLGDSYDPVVPQFIVGQGTMYQQVYGGAAVPAGTLAYDLTHYAPFHVQPPRQTTYWFTTPGNDSFDSSASSQITVNVVADLKAGLNTLQIHPGQAAIISGKLIPGNRGTKITLQAKAGRWLNVVTVKTGRGGKFRVGAIPRGTGKLVLRLKVAAGGGNLGFTTIPQTVAVTAKNKPHPHPSHHQPSPHTAPQGDQPQPVQDFPPPPSKTIQTLKAPGAMGSSELPPAPTPTPAPFKPPTCTPIGPGLPTPCLPAGRG